MRKALIAAATVIAAVAVTVIAVPAANADFTSVKDPRGDTECTVHCTTQIRRNADIVRATAGHDGTRLKHTIRVVGKFHGALLLFNTDSDPYCDRTLLSGLCLSEEGVGLGYCILTPHTGPGHARVDLHRHSVEIFFRARSLGNHLDSYGWHVYTATGTRSVRLGPGRRHRGAGVGASDLLPNPFGWIQHKLVRCASRGEDQLRLASSVLAGRKVCDH